MPFFSFSWFLTPYDSIPPWLSFLTFSIRQPAILCVHEYCTLVQYTYRSLAFLSSLEGELGSKWESSGGSSFPWARSHARSSRSFLLLARSVNREKVLHLSDISIDKSPKGCSNAGASGFFPLFVDVGLLAYFSEEVDTRTIKKIPLLLFDMGILITTTTRQTSAWYLYSSATDCWLRNTVH